jgi:hypothetical protein
MGVDPMHVEHLKLSATGDSQIAEAGIRQIAESVESVATPFQLIPEFRHLRMERI